MELFAAGVGATLLAILVLTLAFPLATNLMFRGLWRVKRSSKIIWLFFDSVLRQTGLRFGPRLGKLTRQSRRRIARGVAKRMV